MVTALSWRAVILTGILFILVCSPAARSAEKLTGLNVGYSAISFDQLPAWMAKETGLFAKNGLDVQLGDDRAADLDQPPEAMLLQGAGSHRAPNVAPERLHGHRSPAAR